MTARLLTPADAVVTLVMQGGVFQEWTEYRQWYRCVNQDCSRREPVLPTFSR